MDAAVVSCGKSMAVLFFVRICICQKKWRILHREVLCDYNVYIYFYVCWGFERSIRRCFVAAGAVRKNVNCIY